MHVGKRNSAIKWHNLLQIGRAMLVTLRRGFISPAATRPTLLFRGSPVLRTGDGGNVLCTACGTCVDACPTHCIRVERRAAIQFEIDWKRCMYCGICASVCPVDALELLSDTQVVFSGREERVP